LNLVERIHKGERPFLIAGPCSAENRKQVMETAEALATIGKVDMFRAGVWKPRTRPGNFEGIGTPALDWLLEVKEKHGIPVCTEVANTQHVEACLKAGIDVLWIGARTTVNPFFVQEIANALQGVDIPVLIKNPIHAETGLWLGAIERFHSAGIHQLGAIIRGCHSFESAPYRNQPRWEMAIELKRTFPEIPIICDPSHIAGNRTLIPEVCGVAMDLNLDGLMVETHIDPDSALSDAGQQLTPNQLKNLLDNLVVHAEDCEDSAYKTKLGDLRHKIDGMDLELLKILNDRFDLIKEIGNYKRDNKVSIFQLKRYFDLLEGRTDFGKELGLNEKMIQELFELIHKYSVMVQTEIKY
jgi:chorismate mutase